MFYRFSENTPLPTSSKSKRAIKDTYSRSCLRRQRCDSVWERYVVFYDPRLALWTLVNFAIKPKHHAPLGIQYGD